MEEQFVYFNNTSDIVSKNIAEYIKTAGYTPVSENMEQYKNNMTGAILANPPAIRGSIENTTDEMWRSARDAFAAPMLDLTQKIGKILSKNKKGSIIFLNSIHAEKPIGDGFLYTAGCAAVQALCREAALIYGSYNVGCFNIMRGIVEGEESYLTSGYSPVYHSGDLRFPKERVPPAYSLNELCVFLLSKNSYILNGSDLYADEGFRMYYGKSEYYKDGIL